MKQIRKQGYQLGNIRTREEDDISQYLTWGAFADLHVPGSCRLYSNGNGSFLARVEVENAGPDAVKRYCKHMENLLFGNDNLKRAEAVKVYQTPGSPTVVWFSISLRPDSATSFERKQRQVAWMQ